MVALETFQGPDVLHVRRLSYLEGDSLLITIPWPEWEQLGARFTETKDREQVTMEWHQLNRHRHECCVKIGRYITFSLLFPHKIIQRVLRCQRFYISPLASPPLTNGWFLTIEPR